MKKNESKTDRIVRVILGVIFLTLGLLASPGIFKTLFLILGVLGVFTGLTGFCLLYKIFKINTDKK